MQIDASGHNFVFPNQCACCGGTAQTAFTVSASKSSGKKVVHTTSKQWDFPYCNRCTEHVKAASTASAVTVRIVLAFILIAIFIYVLHPEESAFSLMTLLLGIVVAIFAHTKLMAAAKRLPSKDCVSLRRAVGYLGWQGSCHTFDVASQKYAFAFMLANQKKLVNLAPDVWQRLQANGVGGPPDRPQSARKYIS